MFNWILKQILGSKNQRELKRMMPIVRRINDYGADLTKRFPDRFGYFASLALPDIDSALHEIERAFADLQVDGVTVHSNYDGVYLTDPKLLPVWEELDRLGAVVFIHPTTPHGVKVLEGIPGPVEDYPAETTRCALDLAYRGYTERFASVKIILSHGGGFLPYAATRFAELLHSLHKQDRSVEQLTSAMKSFYFDTALVPSSGLPTLLAYARPGRVLFGTDYCYAPPDVCATMTHLLDQYDGFEAGQLDIVNTAARSILPRFAQS